MQKLLTTLIGILAFAVLLVLVAVLFGSYTLIFTPSDLNISQRLSLFPTIAISAGVLVAILTFAREKKKQEVERQKHMSEVFLEQVKEGFNTVIDLLADQNNNRITWVRAARTLLKSVELKNQISSEEYKVAYELAEERARNDLYIILSSVDQKSGDRVPRQPQFFYGIDDWLTCETLDEAAIKASTIVMAHRVDINKVPPQPDTKPLARKSVIAIFDFVEYPKKYNDPLDLVRDWDDDWSHHYGIDQGARRYVAHRNQKVAVNKILHNRGKKPSS